MLGRDGGRCGDPEVTKCSTERKTHRKSWKHEVIWVICGILLVWKQSSEGGYGQQQHSGSLWCLYKAPLVLSGPKCAKKGPPHHHTTSILNIWHKAGRIHVFMLFTPNSDPTVWNAQQKPSAALVLQGLTCCVHTLVIWVTVTFLKAVRLFSSDLWHFLSENCCLLDIFFVWVMRDYSDQSVHLSKSLRSHFYHLLMLRLNFSRSPRSSLRA